MGLLDFFRPKDSGLNAKNRLKMVIISDRSNTSPEIMEKIRKDIIEVLTKYVEVDLEGLDITLKNNEDEDLNGPALYANIPIKDIRRDYKEK